MNVTSYLAIIALAVVAITAVGCGLCAMIRALSGAAAVLIGTMLVPVLWVLWGLSFLYTGTPSSDHDERQVYVGVSILMALMSLPLSFATSCVTVHLLRRDRSPPNLGGQS